MPRDALEREASSTGGVEDEDSEVVRTPGKTKRDGSPAVITPSGSLRSRSGSFVNLPSGAPSGGALSVAVSAGLDGGEGARDQAAVEAEETMDLHRLETEHSIEFDAEKL